MGYTLEPRNKKIDPINISAFSWPVMLQETGMGYILGYGANINPCTYVYQNNNIGSPASNDGYKVTSFEAKAMSKLALGYIYVKKFINNQYAEMSEQEKESKKTTKSFAGSGDILLYKQETSERFLEQLKAFADFAEKSNGFRIF